MPPAGKARGNDFMILAVLVSSSISSVSPQPANHSNLSEIPLIFMFYFNHSIKIFRL